MIVFIIAAFAMQPAIQPAVEENEIVVTARRLQRWRGKASANGRGSRCRTTQSTGHGELDQIACDSLRYCMNQLTPDLIAASDRKIAKAVREQRLAALNSGLERCSGEQHRLRVADWIGRRTENGIGNAND